MDFELPETHRTIRSMARDFAQAEIAPHAAGWDEHEEFPRALIPKLGKLGFLGIQIDPEYGGAGLDTLAYALIVEEISRADGAIGLTVASHNGLGSSHISCFGNEEQRSRYLPKLASGEWLGAWALTEPGSGSDAASLTTRAEWKSGEWLLNGSKMFITQGSVAGVTVVLASSNRDAKHRGITAFAIEAGTKGFSANKLRGKYGVRASDTAELLLQDVRLPDSARIGMEGAGFTDAMSILDKGRISIGAMALGIGEAALEAALSYAKERKQFGQAIADFQGIQWMLADSRTELDAARLLLWRAASLADRGEPFTLEASMAKLFASEAASQVCDRALQIHGGYGYMKTFPVERYVRDVRLCRIGEGTSEVQRRVIARSLIDSD
ncbi:MAG TPA: acyl-CoA dehydrogenase family protein [Polyangiales bacterium]|nr:acyl-CoA dehydrogenase family protein [Polyangiales bacterium]